jgi:hypothetical protein
VSLVIVSELQLLLEPAEALLGMAGLMNFWEKGSYPDGGIPLTVNVFLA